MAVYQQRTHSRVWVGGVARPACWQPHILGRVVTTTPNPEKVNCPRCLAP